MVIKDQLCMSQLRIRGRLYALLLLHHLRATFAWMYAVTFSALQYHSAV